MRGREQAFALSITRYDYTVKLHVPVCRGMRRCLKHLPQQFPADSFAGKLPDCHPLFEIFVCHGFNKSYHIPAQLLNMVRDAVNIRCKNTKNI